MGLSYEDAISQLESGGNYGNVTTSVNKKGETQRALGKYGVMDFNVPQWTKEATGTAMTPEEFLKSPETQDAVIRYKFPQYVDKYGWEGAARAWLGGPGGVTNTGATDALGTSTGDYGAHFMRLIGGQSAPPAAANPATQPSPAQAAAATGGVLGAGAAPQAAPQTPSQAPQTPGNGLLPAYAAAQPQPMQPMQAPAIASPFTFPGGWQNYVTAQNAGLTPQQMQSLAQLAQRGYRRG